MLKVEITHGSGQVAQVCARPGQPFLHLLFEAGIGRGRYLCAGAGLCGKCRVRFAGHAPEAGAEDLACLDPPALAQGWRLACQHAVRESCRIELPGTIPPLPTISGGDSLAVDLGTTSIKWIVRGAGPGGAEQAAPNPQAGVGSEVMSRLRYAMSSDAARAAVRRSVIEFFTVLLRASGASVWALAGNSVMLCLLRGDLPLEGLAHAPYGLPWKAGETVTLDPALPPVYVPPLVAPFIGADISAGLACLVHAGARYPFVLADLGTNGEFVLAVDPTHFFASSVPMGPAIEGVGLCCGSVAGPGVIDRVHLGPQGLQWDESSPQGISGSGYVTLLAVLRRLGLIDAAGYYHAPVMPLAARIARRMEDRPLGRVLPLAEGVFLAQRDIEEFLKAKAAVNVALRALLERSGLDQGNVAQVYLAGALGEHLEAEDLLTLGFLPEAWRGRVRIAGNTALAGTLLALERAEVRDWLACLPAKMTVDSLVDRPDFGSGFVRAMRLDWI